MSISKTGALLEGLKADVAKRLSTTGRATALSLPERVRTGNPRKRTETPGPRKATAADLRDPSTTDKDFKHDKDTAGYIYVGERFCAIDQVPAGHQCHHEICDQAKGDGISWLEYDTILHYRRRVAIAKTLRMKEALRKQRDVQLLKDKQEGQEWREKAMKKLGKFGKQACEPIDAATTMQQDTRSDNAVELVGRTLAKLRLGVLHETQRNFVDIVWARISSTAHTTYHWRNPARLIEYFANLPLNHLDAAVMNIRDILELNAILPYEVEYCLRGMLGQCRDLITYAIPKDMYMPGCTLAKGLHAVKEMIQAKIVDGVGNSSSDSDTDSCDLPKNDIYHGLVYCITIESRYVTEMMRAAGKSVTDQVEPDDRLKESKAAGLASSPLPTISALSFDLNIEQGKTQAAVHWLLDMAEKKATVVQLQKRVCRKVSMITNANPHRYLEAWKAISDVEDRLSKLENEKPFAHEHGIMRTALDNAKIKLSQLAAESAQVGKSSNTERDTNQIWDLKQLMMPSPDQEIEPLLSKGLEEHALPFTCPAYTVVNFFYHRRVEGWCLPAAVVRLMAVLQYICPLNPLRVKSILKQLSMLVDGRLQTHQKTLEWTEPLRRVSQTILQTYGYLMLECTHSFKRSDVELIALVILWRLMSNALIAQTRGDAVENFAATAERIAITLQIKDGPAAPWYMKMWSLFADIIEQHEIRCETPDLCATVRGFAQGHQQRHEPFTRESTDAPKPAADWFLESHKFSVQESTRFSKTVSRLRSHDRILIHILQRPITALQGAQTLKYLAYRLNADPGIKAAESGIKLYPGINDTLKVLWIVFLKAETALRRTPSASTFSHTGTDPPKIVWYQHGPEQMAVDESFLNMQNQCNINELCDPASKGKAVGFFEGYRLGFRGKRDIEVLLDSMRLDAEVNDGSPLGQVTWWNDLLKVMSSSGYRCTPQMARLFNYMKSVIYEQLRYRSSGRVPEFPGSEELDTETDMYIDISKFNFTPDDIQATIEERENGGPVATKKEDYDEAIALLDSSDQEQTDETEGGFLLSNALQQKLKALQKSLIDTKETLQPAAVFHEFMSGSAAGVEAIQTMQQHLERYEGLCGELAKRLA